VARRGVLRRRTVSGRGQPRGKRHPSTPSRTKKFPPPRRKPPISPLQGGASFSPATLTGAEHPAIRHERCHGRTYLRDKSSPSSRRKYQAAAAGKLRFRCVLAVNSHTHTDDRAKSRRAPPCHQAHT